MDGMTHSLSWNTLLKDGQRPESLFILVDNLDSQMARYILGVQRETHTLALHDEFSPFGNILSCKIVTDGDGRRGLVQLAVTDYDDLIDFISEHQDGKHWVCDGARRGLY